MEGQCDAVMEQLDIFDQINIIVKRSKLYLILAQSIVSTLIVYMELLLLINAMIFLNNIMSDKYYGIVNLFGAIANDVYNCSIPTAPFIILFAAYGVIIGAVYAICASNNYNIALILNSGSERKYSVAFLVSIIVFPVMLAVFIQAWMSHLMMLYILVSVWAGFFAYWQWEKVFYRIVLFWYSTRKG